MTSPSDYWRMFKARGVGRLWYHFAEAAWFDMRHGTETSTWLPLRAYSSQPSNFDLAVAYQPSFSSEVRKSLGFVSRTVGRNLKDWHFFDLGSGKGKVCFIARKFAFAAINGIEFYPPLHEIAQANARRFNDPRIQFYCEDVTQFTFPDAGLVFYAYNPFQLEIWKRLLSNLTDRTYVIIYNNPVHAEVFEGSHIWFDDRSSPWENKRTVIFASFPKPLKSA